MSFPVFFLIFFLPISFGLNVWVFPFFREGSYLFLCRTIRVLDYLVGKDRRRFPQPHPTTQFKSRFLLISSLFAHYSMEDVKFVFPEGAFFFPIQSNSLY